MYPLDQNLFKILFSVLAAISLMFMGCKMYQIFQLSSYRASEVFKWSATHKHKLFLRYAVFAAFAAAFMGIYVAAFFRFNIAYYFGALGFFGATITFTVLALKDKTQKTPLKVTWRIRRLGIVTFILNGGIVYGILCLGALLPIHFYPFVAFAIVLLPLTVTLAHCITTPIEKAIKRKFINRTMRILDNHKGLIKIGITGSFGKTTVKNILAAILSQKYKVLATPASFNTPMGICRAVGDGLGDVEVFIAEMGARYTGDIAELAKVVRHDYGILTGIGNQHLDTFGSIENLHKTKYAIVEHLPKDGFAFFNGDSEGARMMYGWCRVDKTMACHAEISTEGVYYTDVSMTAKGVTFTLHAGKESILITSPLLGKHMAGTLTLCASVALKLGVTVQEIAEAAKQLKPTPHRLELIDHGDTIVIDDAYNSNVDGARNALEVLSMFEGTRIVVTPGLVELGEEEDACNYRVGEFIAQYADYAILNSSRAEIMKKGCLAGGMPEDKIIIANGLTDSMAKIASLNLDKKVILFENDLPDNFK